MEKKSPTLTDRRQLQQIIADLAEGVILVEPAGNILWANEAALKIHGVTAIEGLGGTAKGYRKRYRLRYRNHHELNANRYPLDRVLAGEEFGNLVVDVQRAEDPDSRWVHRIRSLILTDRGGEADCLALVIDDISEQSSAEERFNQAFNVNPAPAVICRLSDLRYVLVNPGFLEMTGYAKEDVIGHSAYEIDVFAGSEMKDLAIERFNDGRTVPQMEAHLPLPNGESKLVIVAGQPIEIGGEASMLFTFTDLDPRKKAEEALRQSEARFAKSFRLMPVPTLILSAGDLGILDVNDAFTAVFGHTAEEVIGRAAPRLGLLGEPAARAQIELELQGKGSLRNCELQVRIKGGGVIDCLVSIETLTVQDQPCLLVVLQDISERKQTEGELLDAIEAVMQDTSWFSRTVIEKLANIRASKSGSGSRTELSDLTSREKEVLGLLCRGYADKRIAAELDVSVHTVRNHVSTIYSKIDVHKRGAAIVWARERGFTGSASGS